MRIQFKYIIYIVIVVWIFGFWYITSTNRSATQSGGDDYSWFNKLVNAEKQLEQLEKQNKENKLIIQDLLNKARNYDGNDNGKPSNDLNFNSNKEPSSYYEELRRKIYNDIRDLSYYVNSNAKFDKKIVKSSEDTSFKNNFNSRIRYLLAEYYNLSMSNGMDKWRSEASSQMSDYVNKQLNDMQNPKDCPNENILICDLNKACGFGCQMHHVMYCFIDAYFQRRTMTLESAGWRYNSGGYDEFFMPVSESCKNNPPRDEKKSIRVPIIDALSNRPEYLPLAIPEEIADKVKQFHGNPFVWWSGHILNYLMRFQPHFSKYINETAKTMKFQTPCVGIHVRRTDKIGTEAALHELSEYMQHVDEFFDIYEFMYPNKKFDRAVYLATDEIEVLNEAKEKYPNHKFIFNEEGSKTASVHQRYSTESLKGVVIDIYLLSQCDYLVCTFSSQVCRMAYELMQVRYPDASWRFRSLDDIYYFGGQNAHLVVAVLDHRPQKSDEIELQVGDLISIAGDHWNGYSKGRNIRTGQNGLFPSYKAKDTVKAVKRN